MPGAGADAGVEPGKVGALYVGNMIAGQVSAQSHLGAQIADFAGYKGIEAFTVEAACASGGAAVRAGLMAVASGMHDIVVGCGGEKMTDSICEQVTGALATAAHPQYEGDPGATFCAVNAPLLQPHH